LTSTPNNLDVAQRRDQALMDIDFRGRERRST
jgi:hypothetical protein